jgi:hypothetical protein
MNPMVSYFFLYWNPYGDKKFIEPRFVQAVESLYRNCDPAISKEVFVICQGNPESTQETVRGLRKTYGFQLVELTKNIGLSAGINMGFNLSRGKYMAMFSQDVMMTKGCDTNVIRYMETDPNIMHVVPVSDKSDYPHQQCPVREPFGSDVVDIGRVQAIKGRPRMGAVCVEISLNYFSREILNTVGYFDERWKGCYECADYGVRTAMAGKAVIVSYESFIWHHLHTCSDYIGKLEIYADYLQGDPFADDRVGKLMWDKWSPTIRDESRWYSPGSMDEGRRQGLLSKYKQHIYLPFNQDRKY